MLMTLSSLTRGYPYLIPVNSNIYKLTDVVCFCLWRKKREYLFAISAISVIYHSTEGVHGVGILIVSAHKSCETLENWTKKKKKNPRSGHENAFIFYNENLIALRIVNGEALTHSLALIQLCKFNFIKFIL